MNDFLFKEAVPAIEEYWELFQTTGWNDEYNFTRREVESALKHSWYSVSVYQSKKLVGFGRIIADGIHHALIVDLIIHPRFQGQGLGARLLHQLVLKCKESKIRDVQLFAAENKFSFYEKAGFVKRPVNAPGMQLKY